MKHLYIITEGETENEFINRILIPYFVERGLNTHIQAIMVKMSGGGHGFNDIQHFRKTIEPLIKNSNRPIITTFLDYYGINSERKLPNHSNCLGINDVNERIECLENNFTEYVTNQFQEYPDFIPNIIRHEFETLLFSDSEGFDLEDEGIKNAVHEICNEFPNIEDINNTPEGAPSKRLEQIYKNNGSKYKKVTDAVDIIELIGFPKVLEKCPRFQIWVERIIEKVLSS